MKIVRVVGIGLVLVLALMGCQQQAAPTAAPAAANAPAAVAATGAPAPQQTIKLGIQVVMTGPAARTGIAWDRFYRMGIDDINTRGGVKIGNQTFRLEAVTADDKYSADGGREAADRLALAEKVNFVLGGAGAPAAGAQPVYEANKVLQLAFNALDPNLGPSHPYTFMAGFTHSSARLSATYGWLAKTHPEVKRVVFLAVGDATSKLEAEFAQKAGKAIGIEVTTESVPIDTRNVDPIAVRLVQQSPDAIDVGQVGVAPAVFVPLVKALNAQGFRKPLFTQTPVDPQAALDAGPGAEGLVYIGLTDWDIPAVPEAEKQVIRKFVTTYGQADLQMMVEPCYVAPGVLAQAIAKAGTVDDTRKIANALRDGEFDTIWGKVSFGGERTVGARAILGTPVYLTKLQGGKFTTFDSLSASVP